MNIDPETRRMLKALIKRHDAFTGHLLTYEQMTKMLIKSYYELDMIEEDHAKFG